MLNTRNNRFLAPLDRKSQKCITNKNRVHNVYDEMELQR